MVNEFRSGVNELRELTVTKLKTLPLRGKDPPLCTNITNACYYYRSKKQKRKGRKKKRSDNLVFVSVV